MHDRSGGFRAKIWRWYYSGIAYFECLLNVSYSELFDKIRVVFQTMHNQREGLNVDEKRIHFNNVLSWWTRQNDMWPWTSRFFSLWLVTWLVLLLDSTVSVASSIVRLPFLNQIATLPDCSCLKLSVTETLSHTILIQSKTRNMKFLHIYLIVFLLL